MSLVTSSPIVLQRPLRTRALGRLLIWALLAFSLSLILSGLYLPALSITHLWLVTTDYAILDGIAGFFEQGQPVLAWLVIAVTMIFPVLKIAVGAMLLGVLSQPPRASSALLGLLIFLSRWALTDVFILAVVILVINAQLISEANLRPGAYLFASGVVLSTLVLELLRWRVRVKVSALSLRGH